MRLASPGGAPPGPGIPPAPGGATPGGIINGGISYAQLRPTSVRPPPPSRLWRDENPLCLLLASPLNDLLTIRIFCHLEDFLLVYNPDLEELLREQSTLDLVLGHGREWRAF